MNINELFEKLQDNFLPEEINGEYTLHGNCIIWTYKLDDVAEEIPNYPHHDDEDNDEDYQFSFESLSTEELLQEAYDSDFQKLETYLDSIDEGEKWTFSDTDTIDNTISFKLF